MGGGLLLSWGGGVVVLFLFYLAFAPAGTRAFAGVSCYVRPLRLAELVFSHEFHRWDGVVFSSPAVAPSLSLRIDVG